MPPVARGAVSSFSPADRRASSSISEGSTKHEPPGAAAAPPPPPPTRLCLFLRHARENQNQHTKASLRRRRTADVTERERESQEQAAVPPDGGAEIDPVRPNRADAVDDKGRHPERFALPSLLILPASVCFQRGKPFHVLGRETGRFR